MIHFIMKKREPTKMGCAASAETKKTGPEYGQYSMLGNYHQKKEEPVPQQQTNGGPPAAPVDDQLYHTDTEDEIDAAASSG
uniref:Uncharacterized protein n=1 Tax=Magallana gigas TaxID=29159 RepID=K1PS31_MAGGI